MTKAQRESYKLLIKNIDQQTLFEIKTLIHDEIIHRMVTAVGQISFPTVLTCPMCKSMDVMTERKPDGNHICGDCSYVWPNRKGGSW